MTQDECLLEQYMHKMSEVLRCPYTVQAARPARHWWLCPRGLAWFQVLMVWSLVKPPASGGPLSRIGDYLFAARGPGLFLRIRKRTTFPPQSAVTRGPPHPLFHRSCGPALDSLSRPTYCELHRDCTRASFCAGSRDS